MIRKKINNSNIHAKDHEDDQNVINTKGWINYSLKIIHDYIIDDCDCSSIKEINPLSETTWLKQDSIHKNEENFAKDFLEPTPNILSTETNFTSNKLRSKGIDSEESNTNFKNKIENTKYSQ